MLLRTDKFNALAANLDLNSLQQTLADVGNIFAAAGKSGHINLQPHAVDEITVAADLAGDALAEAGCAVDFTTSFLNEE